LDAGAASTRRKDLAAPLPSETRIAAVPGTATEEPHWFGVRWEDTIMRWKISHHGHDPRQIDLIAIVTLIILIVAAFRFFSGKSEPPSTAAFIVPSQSVHW
jgi:hypothetical protein